MVNNIVLLLCFIVCTDNGSISRALIDCFRYPWGTNLGESPASALSNYVKMWKTFIAAWRAEHQLLYPSGTVCLNAATGQRLEPEWILTPSTHNAAAWSYYTSILEFDLQNIGVDMMLGSCTCIR